MLLLADPDATGSLRRTWAHVRGRLAAAGLVGEEVAPADLLDGAAGAGGEVLVRTGDAAAERELVSGLRRSLAGPGVDDQGDRVDVAVVAASLLHGPRLVVLDVDSTLVTGEVVEMLATRAGVEAEVARVTSAAMRGEVDFAESLHRRVALLAGLPVGVLDDVLGEVVPSPGADVMARALADAGVPVGVVSGGFAEVVEPLAASLGIPYAEANRLEVAGGRLTGRVRGDVVDAAAKERFLRRLAAEHDVATEATVAVGDGANDLAMVRAAGTGVAFCAKPVLAAAADVVLRRRDLTAVAHLVGVG